ncbi:heparan-alpha-glucosaminide N-acetyltransferase [Rhizobium panacihumi]|uniref:heparan-alpha-glucosaminide N-acetyltransferase n=1 Tax=Rhizobium panacihumi TaxID=2008450 RepID=UPI003D7BF17D
MAIAEPTSSAPKKPRILLIDTLRGLALIAMASYHFTWDLGFFGYIPLETATQGGWKLYARCIASSFLFLAGFSLVLAHIPSIRWQSFAKRFGMVATAAIIISIGTFFAMPDEWIHFGILHSIALTGLIGLAFLRLPPLFTALVAIGIAAAGYINGHVYPGLFSSTFFDPRYLNWTGFAATPPRSNDFVPLFPWLAAPLMGIAVGKLALTRGWLTRLAALQTKPNILGKAGQHSLAFYLIHQPVLIGLLYIFSLVYPAPAPDPMQSYMRTCVSGCNGAGQDAGMCQRFCSCTGERLEQQSLLVPMNQGQINPQTDERVQSLAQECSIIAR